LQGHENEILNLAKVPKEKQDILLSSSSDRTVRQWDYFSGNCTAIYHLQFAPNCFTVNLEGTHFIYSVKEGIFSSLIAQNLPENSEKEAQFTESTLINNNPHKKGSIIDCVKFMSSSVLLSKSRDGKMYLWDENVERPLREFKLKKASKGTYYNGKFDVNSDLSLLALGSPTGSVLIFDFKTGDFINKLKFKRSKKPINAVAFGGNDVTNLVAVSEPFVWRWEFQPNLHLLLAEKENNDS